MRHLSTSVVLVGALACTAPCLAGGASFTTLNTVNAQDVTVDEFGRTLVLTTDGSFGVGGVYIYEVDANSYNYIGDGFGKGLSANGTEAVGNIFDLDGVQEAARWSESGGWQGLGQLPNGLMCPSISSGYDISGDGSITVGLGWDGCSGRAFKWTAESGMVEMEVLEGGGNRASVISTDGTVAAGFATGGRTPAYWNVADGSGVVINPDAEGEFSAINADGTVMAGRYWDPEIGGLYLWPCYWTEQTGIVIIDSLPGYPGGHMFDMSANGRTIVGTSGIISEGRIAMVWRPEWGSVSLLDKLVELGVQGLDGVFLERAVGVSVDGTKVVGTAILPPPAEGEPSQIRGFLATLPEQLDPACDEDFDGDGQVGFTDLTQLLGSWGPCPGCAEDLDGDGQVGFTDLTQLLGSWGPCA